MTASITEKGLFQHRGSILIERTLVGDREQDILIDETGRIAGIGKGLALREGDEGTMRIAGEGSIALPGLVNTHTHAAMTLLRGYADDMPLQEWLSDKIWPLEAHLTGEDVYWGTRLACLEMIRSGTTAFNDMYFFMEDAARAVDESGIRAVLSYGFIDLFNPDKREREIQATERLVDHIRSLNNPRIRAAAGPHAPYTVSREGLSWLADFSREKDIGIHIHLSETEREVQDTFRQCGMSPPLLLDECGILTGKTVAAHCCWLDRDDCTLLGRRGVHVSHNPVSNMKLAVNRAMPYHWLREEGVNITLGTDGCASNNNLDLFESMKTGALLQKFAQNSQTLMPSAEALEMATSSGARALGFGKGLIKVGEPADIILIDRKIPANTPLHNRVSNMVYACNGSAVKTVICNGRVLMEDRCIPGEVEVLAGAARAAADLVKRAGMVQS